MKQLTPVEVHAAKVAELGLDPAVLDLTTVEAIAAALRRAASVRCPCSTTTLVRSVVRPLRGLVDEPEALRGCIEATLEAMIAYGDLLEHRDISADSDSEAASLIYAAPLSYIPRESGAVLLVGVGPSQVAALPMDLEGRIEYLDHVRRISATPSENLASLLSQCGFVRRPTEAWLRAPHVTTPSALIGTFDSVLNSADPSRDVAGLSLLDSSAAVRYYRGRWMEVKRHTGRFVGRRRQAYGADRWCYVELRDGQPERMIDLPLEGSRWRGCDDAWHLQLAIDAMRGTPQQFRTTPSLNATHLLELYSPVPMWARRRWDAIGTPASTTGCLFAYRLPDTELAQELQLAKDVLWLAERT